MHRWGNVRREEGKQSGGQLTLTFVRASKIGSLRTMMSVRDNTKEGLQVLWKADGIWGRVATSLTAFSAFLAARGWFILGQG